MDKRISGSAQFEEEKKRLRHENIMRQFKEYFAQEALEAERRKEFTQNGRDFEFLPEFEKNSTHHRPIRQQRPNANNGSHNIWSSPLYGPCEDYGNSPNTSTASSSVKSNYYSFASPLSTSSPKEEDFLKPAHHRQLFHGIPDYSAGAAGFSPLAKPLTAQQPFVPIKKKSVATQTDDVLFVNMNNNEVLTSSVFKNAARETAQKYKTKKHCAFCMKNKDHERVYTSHNLKDANGRIMCPVLRNYICPKCGATGDSAHTISYCTEGGAH